ncbi:NUDIX domain-containing protein [Ruminococcus sp.]|uniref:NUDIX hydrolase n=1 Tax=Ruminococcus sp. TaxID=41978 RepID=UPI0025EB0F4E|nr:NUDIX domain-containing protein [Ruminococcus sp.]MBQ8966537.1 NUDIX domain-containing protein [Ruminococcus sp.]
MGEDMTLPCGEGLVSVRVGAIIMREGRLLLAGNDNSDYLYTVGGRVKIGENAEEAVVREVSEETGIRLETDRLYAVHENYFYGDAPSNMDRLIYEIAFFFLMKTPADFAPVSMSFAEGDSREHIEWVYPDTEKNIYPAFFRKLDLTDKSVKHYVTDERRN